MNRQRPGFIKSNKLVWKSILEAEDAGYDYGAFCFD